MALNTSDFITQQNEVMNSFWQSMQVYLSDKLNFLFIIGKIILILILIYLIIKIILQIMKLRDSQNLNNLTNQVSEINQKISLLLEKQKSKEKSQKLNKNKK